MAGALEGLTVEGGLVDALASVVFAVVVFTTTTGVTAGR